MDRVRHSRRWLTALTAGKTARWRAAGLASAIAGLAASGAVVIAGSAVPASAAPAEPTVSVPLTAVTSVSCVSAARCWAGGNGAKGSAIIATANGGATWHVEYATTRLGDIADIDCPSAAHCLAIGDSDDGASTTLLETTDGGKVWSTHAAPKSLALPEALSCANGSDCWAVGYAGHGFDAVVARTTDGGGTWTREPVPALETAMSSPFGISCASSTHCLVTGEGTLTTTNGGKAWAKHAAAAGTVPLGPATCPSTRDCYAVFDVTSAVPSFEQGSLYTSANGGVTWKDVLSNPRHVTGFGGISCPSTSACVAVGDGYAPKGTGTGTWYGVSEFTSTSGRHWTQSTVAKVRALYADSCAARTSDCIAVGQSSAGPVILKSANDGATWTSEPLPRT